MVRHRFVETLWGHAAYVAGDGGLLATFLPETDRRTLERRIARDYPDSREDAGLLPRLTDAFRAYFEGRLARFDVRLDLNGLTDFRRRVMECCRRIPRGRTASYQDLARAAGSPNASRAAGSTMARNPLPLIVPCHRVVRSDGSVGGFSSPRGVEQKRRLLRLEGVTLD